MDECTHTIEQEVQTVKQLVDEFSQFSRFPAAQPVPADLNEIVESARWMSSPGGLSWMASPWWWICTPGFRKCWLIASR